MDHFRPDWFTKINTRALDINSGNDCIVAQAFADLTPVTSGYSGYESFGLALFLVPGLNDAVGARGLRYWGFTGASQVEKAWISEIVDRKVLAKKTLVSA